MKSSVASRPSKRRIPDWLIAAAVSAIVIAVAALFCFRRCYILYYGDAQAHLNISRNMIDSRTPGYDQLGTVWLPLLHIVCLPFVTSDVLWSSGLAGTIPVAACFVFMTTCFYLSAKLAYESNLAAVVVLGCLLGNPNLLYLGSIPLTEIVFAAGLSLLLLALLHYRQGGTQGWLAVGVVASWWMSLTRYDGWFLIPFSAVAFAGASRRHKVRSFFTFCVLAAIAPIYWVGHNWWESGNALDFYNGPYSAAAIQGSKSYPGFHDWSVAATYYETAGRLCSGLPLFLTGLTGFVIAILKRAALPAAFLLLTPAFYVWSIHSSRTPIFVPELWPHGYYNTRYGLAVVIFAAFACGAWALLLPRRARSGVILLPAVCAITWMFNRSTDRVICWKESEQNSIQRRAWTAAAANYVREQYSRGTGIASPFGDLTGIYCRAQLPLREILHEGNGPAWVAMLKRPPLLTLTEWALTQQGDHLSTALHNASKPVYSIVTTIEIPKAAPIEIWRRSTR